MNFHELRDKILDYERKFNPVHATYLGIHNYDHTLGNYDSGFLQDSFRERSEFLDDLKNIDAESLGLDDSIDHELMTGQLSANLRTEEELDPFHRMADAYSGIALYGVYLLMMRNFDSSEMRGASILSRVSEIPGLIKQGQINLAAGKNIPEIWTAKAIESAAGGVSFFSTALNSFGESIPSLSEDLKKAGQIAAASLEDYLFHLKERVLPVSTGKFAIGKDLFDHILKNEHLLPYDHKDLYEIGDEAVHKTIEEMEKLASKISYDNDWMDIVEEIKNDHPLKDDLLDSYREEMERARDFVIEKDLVSVPEDESLKMVYTPPFERNSIPFAAYMSPAPFDKEQEGNFWVTPVNETLSEEKQKAQLRDHNIWGIPLTALHEGYPGHHLQLIHANRIESPVRKQYMTSVFAEGWALYCEKLMYEQGFYSDGRTRMIQLKDQLWRACRVVIDVSIHCKGMSFDKAVQMLIDTARLGKEGAIAEVKRYTYNPTQPMSYIVGEMQVKEFKKEIQRKEGLDFDLKNFHDNLLSYGTIPVALIRKAMASRS